MIRITMQNGKTIDIELDLSLIHILLYDGDIVVGGGTIL